MISRCCYSMLQLPRRVLFAAAKRFPHNKRRLRVSRQEKKKKEKEGKKRNHGLSVEHGEDTQGRRPKLRRTPLAADSLALAYTQE